MNFLKNMVDILDIQYVIPKDLYKENCKTLIKETEEDK